MIPNKKLEVKRFEGDDLTLGEVELLSGESFSAKTFRQFLIKYTNWTDSEIREVTVKELKELVEQLKTALENTATPPK